MSLSRRHVLELGGATLVGSLAGCTFGAESTPSEDDSTPNEPANGEPDAASPYADVYREAIDSIVFVSTGQGQGTGFVYGDSSIVTNAHVVGDASTVEIRFSDGSWADGQVVGTDPHSDLAAIEVDEVPDDASPLPFVEEGATVGQEVVAIGNPYNLEGSLTTGVVSGVERSIPAPTGYRIPDAIQTDAAVNPGNSGGPLMSLEGRVVAVINSGGGDNIAFGISAALTRRVVPELIETGSFDHAYTGMSFGDVTPRIARANDLDQPRGLIVVSVVSGGPADGVLQPSESTEIVDGSRVPVGGDVVLRIDDTELLTTEDLGSYLALEGSPGDTVEIDIVRDGTEQTVELELGTRPD